MTFVRIAANCGKGFGNDALIVLSEYLRQTLDKQTLIMRLFAKNERAVLSYNKADFQSAAKPIWAYMSPEYRPLFGDGDYGTGGDTLLVKDKSK